MNHIFIFICCFPILFLLLACDSKPSPEHLGKVRSILKNTADNMVFVKGGSFMMGDSGNGKDIEHFRTGDEEYAVKNITLDSYSINKYETTWGELVTYLKDSDRYDQYQYEQGKNHRPYIAVSDPASPNYFKRAARAPSWYEAEGYCLWLAKKTGLPYALPTEAQWEYAARSRGERVRYATHDGMTLVLDDYMYEEDFIQDPIKKERFLRNAYDPLALPKGNAYGITSGEYKWYARIVGSYPPNKLGIHDMSGNVQEWVADWYEKDHYKKMDELNPQGPSEPKYWGPRELNDQSIATKTLRDWVGSGVVHSVYARRDSYVTDNSSGFRCALNIAIPIE